MDINWHNRYTEQAGWTRQVRQYLLGQLNLAVNAPVLEVGCGTGAIRPDLVGCNWFGADIDLAGLQVAQRNIATDGRHLVNADGYALPFVGGRFNLVYGHYVLLWQKDPVAFLKEMVRLASPGGYVAMFAEPDYLARIDTPVGNVSLGSSQNRSLRQQGCRLDAGRNLASHMHAAGLTDVRYGVIGGEWQVGKMSENLENFVLWHDLQNVGEVRQNRDDDVGFVYVPTFYGVGAVEKGAMV